MFKTCPKGHRFYKTSDCPVCPECEKTKKQPSGWISKLAAPARRALENQGISELSILAKYKESEILKLHGIGPSSIPILRQALSDEGLNFNT
ncbi:hypothetical protein [Aquiflexum gelatinilyticum]|uniref:RNA polymerase alpha subunit C-terminal domain-containing protein n=1 Tax=Aquiflexum gelatinilyticum TaxID=2961943 RepID=A0A9X2PA27_9BACT|nr:hypothetical protein [Aquiflexum gelatinilyticum]MCR9014875.1 hypothetical protein [Aquiflexum gelatinilyticum]